LSAEDASAPPRRRRLARALVLTFAAVLAILAILLLAAHWTVSGGLGARFVGSRLNGISIPGAGELRVTGFGGDLLDIIRSDTIELVDEDGPWLTLTDVSLNWRPRALSQRVVQIEELRAGEAVLHRLPRLAPREPQAQRTGRRRPLPDASLVLDSLAIDRLAIEEDAFGRAGEFTVTAAAALRREGGGAIGLNAVEAESGADALSLEARLEPDGALQVDAAAGSAADGLIARLLGAPEGEAARLDLEAAGATTGGNGRFTLSFAGEPAANGEARWDEDDIGATAHVEAARWAALRGLSEQAGPVADLQLGLTQYRSETPAFTLALDAERLDVTLSGPPPTGENLRQEGLSAELAIRELGLWTGGAVVADSAAFAGQIRRDDSGFGGEGTLTAERFGAFSIRAERLEGPATLRFSDGVLAFESTLRGTGGGGANQMVADLVGPTPDVTLQGEFRSAERLLAFERIALQSGASAADLSMQLRFNDDEPRLSLEGSAQALPLGPILPGFAGTLDGDFTVLRQSAGAPMQINATGAASGVSGAPEIVAGAVGSALTFNLEAQQDEGTLNIQRAIIEGPNIRLGAQGALGGESGLGIDIEAALQGPLPLPGGMELSGEAMGRGTVSGALDAPVIEGQVFAQRLLAGGAVFEMPVADLRLTTEGGLAGDVAIQAGSRFGDALANARFARREGQFEAPEIALDWADITVRGGVSARADGLLEGDITLSKSGEDPSPWPGVLDGQIGLRAQDGEQGARIAIEGGGIAFPDRQIWIDTIAINGEGPLSRLGFTVSGDGILRSVPTELRAEGVVAAGDGERTAEFGVDVQAGNVSIASEQPVTISLGEAGARALRARLAIDSGQLSIDYDDGPDGALIAMTIDGVPISVIEAAQREPRLDGVLDGQLRLDTRGGGMSGDVAATLTGARAVDTAQNQIDMDLRGVIADEQFTGSLDMLGEGGMTARAEGSLPLERGEGLLPIRLAMDQALSGRLTADGPIDTISSLLLGAEQQLEGAVRLDAQLSGSARDPRFTGDGGLSAGRFDDAVSGLVLDDLEIALAFSNDQIQVTRLSANDGRGGSMSGNGAARSRGGAWTGEVSAAVQDFRVVNRADAQARLSGDLTAQVTPDRRLVQGALVVQEGEFAPPQAAPAGVRTLEVVEINLPGEEGAERVTGRSGPPIELDIDLSAPRRLFIRSANINAELSLDTHIGGTVGAVEVTGVANVVRGDADLAGRRFTFDTGRVRFNGEPMAAELDFSATREAPDLTAVVRVTGTPREPRIVLESRPPLPQDEILAQVLFGRSATDLTALEAAQLASALASMAGGGGFDALGSIRSGLGLDRLSIGQDRTGSAQISGGRYLTDNVYLEVSTGAQGSAAAQVEWQALSDFAIISRLGSADDTSISVRWRRTY
jgi:translocation and assembly module TamB